jgi:hypothetical protein
MILSPSYASMTPLPHWLWLTRLLTANGSFEDCVAGATVLCAASFSASLD